MRIGGAEVYRRREVRIFHREIRPSSRGDAHAAGGGAPQERLSRITFVIQDRIITDSRFKEALSLMLDALGGCRPLPLRHPLREDNLSRVTTKEEEHIGIHREITASSRGAPTRRGGPQVPPWSVSPDIPGIRPVMELRETEHSLYGEE